MKKLRVLTLAAVTFLSTTAFAQDMHFGVDTKGTKVEWLGEKVTGEHKGNVSVKSGDLHVEGGDLKEVAITIDMNSITCTDIEDKEYNGKLVGHLKSDDFFGTATHPEATFKSTSVSKLENGKYQVKGMMTIKGKSLENTFEVMMKNDDSKATATAKIVIDRSKYDVKYGSTSFFDSLGDKAIYDNFTLTVDLLALKK